MRIKKRNKEENKEDNKKVTSVVSLSVPSYIFLRSPFIIFTL
jgi:hypothetical protein